MVSIPRRKHVPMLISGDILRCFTFKEMPDMVSFVNSGNVPPNTLLHSQHSQGGIKFSPCVCRGVRVCKKGRNWKRGAESMYIICTVWVLPMPHWLFTYLSNDQYMCSLCGPEYYRKSPLWWKISRGFELDLLMSDSRAIYLHPLPVCI